MRTINEEEKKEETMRTIEHKLDADLHEFSYDGRKFFVRLNQFVSSFCHDGFSTLLIG